MTDDLQGQAAVDYLDELAGPTIDLVTVQNSLNELRTAALHRELSLEESQQALSLIRQIRLATQATRANASIRKTTTKTAAPTVSFADLLKQKMSDSAQ